MNQKYLFNELVRFYNRSRRKLKRLAFGGKKLRKQRILENRIKRLFERLNYLQQTLKIGSVAAATTAAMLLFQPNAADAQTSFAAVSTNPFSLVDIGAYSAPAFADLDNDGDKDMMVGTSTGIFKYFKNSGTAAAANFSTAPVSSPFGLTDIGSYAIPTLADLDNDGDIDLMAGNSLGIFKYFTNTGTAAAPAFGAVQTDPFNLYLYNYSGYFYSYGYHCAPSFADLDADGDYDLVVGDKFGYVWFFENTGTAAAPNFPAYTYLYEVGSYATPACADLDCDGDLDLVVGKSTGNFYYFENTGTSSAYNFPSYSLNPFSLTDVGIYSAPAFADLDNDGDKDLMVGEGYGNFKYFQNTTSSCSGTPAGGTASAVPDLYCSGGTSTLTLSGNTSSCGITYQWQSSPEPVTVWSNIVGATSSTYIATPGASTNYRCIVNCTISGLSANSTSALVTLNPGQANDLPCNAQVILANDLTPGDNSCAGSTGEPAKPGCWSTGIRNTVWYTITTGVGQTSIKIKTNLGTLLNTQIAIYSGACGAGMAYVDCNDDGAACGASTYPNSEMTVAVSASTTYYIAVDGYADATGTFSIVWIDGASTWPAVPGQDCISGIPVCSSTFTIGNPGYQAVGNICDFPGGGTNCLDDGERGSAWYEISINANGNLMFTIEPNDVTLSGALVTASGTDYDFAIWKKTGTGAVTCSNIFAGSTPLACNFSSIGITGLFTSGNNPLSNTYTGHTYTSGAYDGAFEAPLAVTNGDVYWLVISNYSNSTSGFTINFGSSTNGFNFTAPNPLLWTGGASSTDWFNAANWGNCAIIPTSTIDAVVASSSVWQPVINANAAVCKSITINAGAKVTINSGRNLDVYGNYNNQGTLTANSASTVTIKGADVQTMDGTMVSPSNFGNLTVTKTAGSVTLNQNIQTSSNLTTTNATSILNTNGNYVKVGGNFDNATGNTTYTNTGTLGTLEFNGSGAQSYNQGSSQLDLNFVKMNNTGSGLTLSTDLFIKSTTGTLNLTSGKIITSTYVVNVANTATTSVTTGNTNSFVQGNLRRYILSTGAYDFPVGDATKLFQRANINFTAATSIGNLLARFDPWPGGAGYPPAQGGSECATTYNLEAEDNGYWTVTADANPTTGTYYTTLYPTNTTNAGSANGWTVMKRATMATTGWSLSGGCVASSTASLVKRNGMNGFSVIASAQATTALPIELLDFTANYNGKSVDVKWETASEKNNDYFTVERSPDAVNYSFIGNIQSKAQGGNSTGNLNYAIADEKVSEGNVYYYRLKQTDFDGSSTHSEVAYVKIDDTEIVTIKPNPTSGSCEIIYKCFASEVAYLKVYDNRGRLVVSKNIDCLKGANASPIDLTEQPEGIFFVTLTVNDKVYKSKLLKSK